MARPRREVKRYARKLRRNQTISERRLWPLKLIGFWAQRVTPIGYVADYYQPLSRVVVEIDGGVHDRQKAADQYRDDNHRRNHIYTIRVSKDLVLEHRLVALNKIVILTLWWQLGRWFWF
jgi:very-short-patch-repair endonuclease